MQQFDVAVIGGGPAGIAAALQARKIGASVALFERNDQLGGILRQCIHSGFGLQYFKEELTGPEYAQRFIDQLENSGITIFLSSMVLGISANHQVTAIQGDGLIQLQAKSLVLAMGCRERTRGEIRIPGARISGVYTAGQAQYYINIENQKPGKRFVILGSGDIGLIMARRLTLEGMEVEGVYELMPYANGLGRNIKNCLDDFNIPLHLSTTVTRIIGKDRVEAVEVSNVDEALTPIDGTQRIIPCDGLLLSIGLIPENELSRAAGVQIDNRTGGPLVDALLQTSFPGIFACGNVLHVHDLVDNVTAEAQRAGQAAAEFALNGAQSQDDLIKIQANPPIGYTMPMKISCNQSTTVFFRIRRPVANGRLTLSSNGSILFQGPARSFKPSVMEHQALPSKWLAEAGNTVTLEILSDTEEIKP